MTSAAALALRARVAGLARGDLAAALGPGRPLVRTWCLRGTAHVLSPEDVPVVAAAISHAWAEIPRWLRRRGLSPETWAPLRRAILDALTGAGRPLTREDLRAIVSARIPGARELMGSWGGVLRMLCAEGSMVFGPTRGPNTTFVPFAGRGDGVGPSREAAEAALLDRYLRAYGPAEPRDLAHWTGLNVGWADDVFARAGARVAKVAVDGREAFVLAEDRDEILSAARPRSPAVRLLGVFVPYLLAHKRKDLYLDPARRTEVFRAAGWVSPVVLVDGRVAGTWSQDRRGKVEPKLFRALSKAERAALAGEIAAVRRFLLG